jgi:CobQ-like glutamine amidotransferase family enzyme
VPEVPSAPPRTLRVCALYPDLLNIYADRGNLLMLQARCRWRGIGFELLGAGVGEPIDGEEADLYYMGGGQDRDQILCAADLLSAKADALAVAVARGAMLLGVCGGYQLLGHSYDLGDETIAGLGLLDLRTERGRGRRLIGNVAIEVDLPGTGPRVLAGFENHGGRTHLLQSDDGTLPLGRVLKGHGNNGSDRLEGARNGRVIGTYLHGPLLPKNAWFADWLIAGALRSEAPLPALEDGLELAAHADACRAAGL